MKWWQVVLFILFALLVQIGVDYALKVNLLGRRSWTALLDSVAHGALAAMVILPWARRWNLSVTLAVAAWLAAVLIDVDHFVAAGSFSISDAISLPRRPMAHSFVFAGGISLLAGLVFRSWNAVVIFALSLISHLSRDASGGGMTPLLWPSEVVLHIPKTAHLVFWPVFSLLALTGVRK